MGRGSARLYNLISLIFLVLTILVLVLVISRLVGPPVEQQEAVIDLPTLVALPTATPTFTPSLTLTPTFTFTPSPVPSDTPIPSPTLSETPDLTATASLFTYTPSFTPSLTPSITNTPEVPPTLTLVPSLTITATLAPTLAPEQPTVDPNIPPTLAPITQEALGPTLSPFPFAPRDQIIYTLNFANTAGCNWQGVGGQVFDVNNQALPNINVHVIGAGGFDRSTVSGTNSLYGQSGWEINVGNTVAPATFIVELRSPQGTVISPQVQVTFPGNCNGNLALVNFVQTRPF
jgi:hypothetical protein